MPDKIKKILATLFDYICEAYAEPYHNELYWHFDISKYLYRHG